MLPPARVPQEEYEFHDRSALREFAFVVLLIVVIGGFSGLVVNLLVWALH